MISVRVTEASQISEARREACREAAMLGFDEGDAGRVALVATELATNLVRHGGGGELLAGARSDGAGDRLDIIALDKGRGIADVGVCLRDGYSTAGSAGNGLGAVSRQAAVFDVFSRVGGGTAVLARLVPRGRTPAPQAMAVAGICLRMPGETVCGDAWAQHVEDGGCTLLLADGLGHGPLAAHASTLATETFARRPRQTPEQIIAAVHAALAATRGAAVSVALLDPAAGQACFCGIGNVSGTLLTGGRVQRMVTMNGTAGANARRLHSFSYAIGPGSVAVLHSDGLHTSWSIDAYPGLLACDPALVAAVLYRDFARGRDDVAVVVAKLAS